MLFSGYLFLFFCGVVALNEQEKNMVTGSHAN